MEFHDVLHGLITIQQPELAGLLGDLLDTAEIHRLRNMRQMNFDVPLIQELGRSRRLPHSVGVVHLAVYLGQKGKLTLPQMKTLLAAALIHDAAIPPYGHLVESEFKQFDPSFKHETILESLIYGDKYKPLMFDSYLGLHEVFREHEISPKAVLELTCPTKPTGSPIAADVDIDNLDNVHRMAVMLGWHSARENIAQLLQTAHIVDLDKVTFSADAEPFLKKWLEYRQRIYTLIIGHPECIPYNALQADLCRLAVQNEILTPKQWKITEPEFEEKLRKEPRTSNLARQLIEGCKYKLVDYVWMKDFNAGKKKTNAALAEAMQAALPEGGEHLSHFIWNEQGLISRRTRWYVDGKGWQTLGDNSSSCMVALVHTGARKHPTLSAGARQRWRECVTDIFRGIAEAEPRRFDYPDTYTGRFFAEETHGFDFGSV